jgi:hypothetical protein
MSEPDELITLSPDQKIHAAALEAHLERRAARRFQNQLYWYRTVKERLLSEQLGILNSKAKVIDASAAERHESMLLPDGRRIRDVKTHELFREFDRLQVPNFSHTMSRSAAILAFAEFIEPVYRLAGQKAVDEFLARNKDSCSQ